MLTAEKIREALNYHPETGVFTWRKRISRKSIVGAVTGTQNGSGYLKIGIYGQRHYAHRLAWLYMTGSWPAEYIDHIDGDRSNNRWSNLREATHAQNMWNMKHDAGASGFKGVVPNRKKWAARFKVDGELIHLGSFDTPKEAYAVYQAAVRNIRGEFARL